MGEAGARGLSHNVKALHGAFSMRSCHSISGGKMGMSSFQMHCRPMATEGGKEKECAV